MKAIVAKRKNKALPWGIEFELQDGRCIYMSATHINTYEDRVDVIVGDASSISVPRASIRKILIMGNTDAEED